MYCQPRIAWEDSLRETILGLSVDMSVEELSQLS